MKREFFNKLTAFALICAMVFTTVFQAEVLRVSAAEKPILKIGTFNIAANKKPDTSEQLSLLQSNGLDVVGLQEVDKNTGRNNYDMLASFAGEGGYADSYFQKAIDYSGGEYGIGLLSNKEVLAKEGGPLVSDGIDEARAWEKMLIDVEGKQVAVYNTHFTHETIEARAKQIKELLAVMDTDKTEYKVVMGDFNVDQSHDELDPFLEKYDISNGKDGVWYDTFNGIDNTMKTNAVDNIVVSRNIAIKEVKMVETSLSDHNLFYIEAELLDEPVVSKALLNAKIEAANALNFEEYSADSFSALDDVLIEAEKVSDSAAVSQEQVNKAAEDLIAAMASLKKANLALHKPVSVSGLEVNDGRFTADKAVDGEVSAASRVSFSKTADLQWLLVDLEEEKTVSHFVINYESQAPAFKIQVSTNGEEYTDVYEVHDIEGRVSGIQDITINPVKARYVKYVQLERWKNTGNGQWYSGSIYEFEVYANEINYALNKEVSASSLEVSDGRFTAEMAVDGEVSKTSRVSFGKGADEQWLLVDMGSRREVAYFVINYESQAPAFKIQTSLDGETFEDVYEAEGLEGQVSNIQEIKIDPVRARYVKYVQLKRWKHSGNGQLYSGSIYEFEVYKGMAEENYTASQVLKTIAVEAPTLSEDQSELVFPEVPEGFEVSLYGCDTKQVVAMDGRVTLPIQDMNVNVLYQVKNLNDEEDIAYSEKDIQFVVPGTIKEADGANAKPNVMPGLREWRGATGEFTLTADSKIVISDEAQRTAAERIKFYFAEMLNRDIEIAVGKAEAGDIALVTDAAVSNLGEEGYTLDIADILTITSAYEKGLMYGGISVTQILYQEKGMNHVPKGTARDYPKYEVRSGMLDVARTWVPMKYLREMTIYMSWFKLNEVQVHINDYWGATHYSAFRLESDTYPMITATDGSYSKDEYRQYQLDMREYGIDVITEIDTPYHAECFRSVPGAVMLKEGALDIREQSTYDIIENVLDEYLDGPNPVIQSKKFHMGTDEYDKAYSEQMRKYTDHFIKYINAKGYETRLWGSLGSRGFNGTTPVSNEATVNLWAPYWADVKETYAAGYDIINTCGGWLYIVPGGNAGYPDRMDLADLYNKFEVNNFSPSRNAGQGTAIMPVAHPQTIGAEFAVWNDMTSFKGGFSEFDIYDRFKSAVMLVAEKTWYGEKTAGQTSDEFMERVGKIWDEVPGANPGRIVDSKGLSIASIDFEKTKGGKVIDQSGNGYHAVLTNTVIKQEDGNRAAVLDGTGYISMPFKSVGYPYTVLLDVRLAEDTPENTMLFSGEDGTLYANIDGTGKVGFARGSYKFSFEYELPKNEWVRLGFTCDNKNTTLFVDGEKAAVAQNMGTAINNRNDSTTFILPTEKIGENLKGFVDNLKIANRALSGPEIKEYYQSGIVANRGENIAPTAIESQASNNYSDTYNAQKAIDRSLSTRWATKDGISEATLELTFAGKVTVGETRIVEFNAANNYIRKYNIEYWDGNEWVVGFESTVQESDKTSAGVTSGKEFGSKFEPITASKIRLHILEAARPSIFEFELYTVEEPTEEPEKTEFDVTVNGEVVHTGAYNEKVTIEAPKAPEGKEFTGWKLDGKIVSTKSPYTFYISGDMYLEACYDEVEELPVAILTATHVTKKDDGKADMKFVGQLALPKGYKLVNAGLVWSTKDDMVLDVNSGLKPTYITAISNTNQFSVTIKGLPKGMSIRGKIFATVSDEAGNTKVIYSEEKKASNK